uniref:Resistance protein PSH-RGH6 n=1 Tax=Solanum tuberosum TaxID=4113 RepID=M1C317_SOLTU
MAAYAAVTSLLHTLDNLSQTHTSHSLLYKKEQTEVLSDKYTFLKTFLEDFTNIFNEDIKMKHLERMIQEAANGVEDTIDSHVYDSSVVVQSKRVRRKADMIFHQNLEYAIEEIGLIQREMRFLSMEESWTLLRDKVFGNGGYPPELEKIGRYIGHQCQGLPLAVVAIGGLLSKMSKETSSWENVAEKVGSLMTSDTMDCLNILSLSYNHLPQYLKTCFLYMGVFAETREIPVWKLIKLWIAEGFVKKVNHKNLEDVAEENLRELVDRSLVLVGKHTSLGKIKTCKMHDLVRDMCLREAQYENFIHFKTRYDHDDLLENISCLRRVADFHKYTHSGLSKLMPLTRSVFFKYPYFICYLSQSSFRLLRILDVCFTTSLDSSQSISELVHLRYLACPFFNGLVQSLCKLRNIQNFTSIWFKYENPVPTMGSCEYASTKTYPYKKVESFHIPTYISINF